MDLEITSYVFTLIELTRQKKEFIRYTIIRPGSRMPSEEYFKNDWQLLLYAFVLKKRYPYIQNVSLVWHMLKFDKEIISRRSNEDLEKLKNDIIQLIHTIENAEEFPSKPSKLCDWCRFKSICK